MSTAAALIATGLTGVAQAQTVETIYGNGASLPAPYFRQAADCYSIKTDLIFAGTPPVEQTMPDFSYTGNPPQDCATTDAVPNDMVVYKSTGSGGGIGAFFSHDPIVAGDISPIAGNQYFPSINYALSETSLGTSDVAAYNNGGTVQGVTVVAPGATPGTGQYPNPVRSYGPMIQFPLLIAPVTIAYDPVYKKTRTASGITEYSFNLTYPRADGSGGLRLQQTQVCAIFNGTIVNWNAGSLKTLNGGVSLQDPSDTGTFSVDMQIVGREDSSGTTSLWTRFLSNACASYAGNSYPDSNSRLPGSYVDSTGATRTQSTLNKDLVGAVWNKSSDNRGAGRTFYSASANGPETVGKYTLANGNDGVAKYIDFTAVPAAVGASVTQGRIGYVGPDFVLPGVIFTEANDYNLQTADVRNAAGYYRAPTSATALAAFGSILAPESAAHGNYVASSACASGTGTRCRNRPQDWVEAASKSSALANPAGVAAYPIVGTSNLLTYTCFADAGTRRTLVGFLDYYYNSQTINNKLGLLSSAGFDALPAGWRKAISQSFVDPTDPNGTGLTIALKGSAKPYCKNVTIGG
jgi:ABC-type phosphate transport system substrate-binding protein